VRTKPRFTCGSVQTRRWLGFEAWQCAHIAATRAVIVPSPAMDVHTYRVPPAGHADQRAL
jgi:hypothetical protein